MKQNGDDAINRRSVLKKIGTVGAVGTLGFSTPAVATTPSETHVQNVLESPQVKRIREEIGSFTVLSSSVTRTQYEGTTITQTTIETNRGTLLNGEVGSTSEAVLELDLSNDSDLYPALPADLKPVPAGSTASLLSDGSSDTYLREPSNTESEELKQVITEPVIGAVYTSDISGFNVIVGTVSEETSDIDQYHVGANGREISADTVEKVLPPAIPCWLSCAGCAASIVDKGVCTMSCASGVAIAYCLGCMFRSNIGFVSGCAGCIQCIS